MNRKNHRESLRVAGFLAKKSILHNKSMLLMIVIIVGMGYLSTIFAASVINGLKFEIEEKAINGIAGHVMLEPEDGEQYIYNVDQIEKKAYAIPHVVGVSPEILVPITMTDKFGTSVTQQVFVIDPEKERITTTASQNLVAGDFLSSGAIDEIVIGAELTKRYRSIEGQTALDVDSGEKIKVTFPNGYSSEMVVKGVYAHKLLLTDQFVYMSKKELMKIYGLDSINQASRIAIKADARGYEADIVEKLSSFGVDANIVSWQTKLGILSQFTDSLMMISKITSIIGIIIAFATVYIMIYINVLQKRSQIGIQKAIGIPGKTILQSYMIQSLIYGVLGTLVGILMTLAFIKYFTLNPIPMPMGNVVPTVKIIDFVWAGFVLIVSAVFAG